MTMHNQNKRPILTHLFAIGRNWKYMGLGYDPHTLLDNLESRQPLAVVECRLI